MKLEKQIEKAVVEVAASKHITQYVSAVMHYNRLQERYIKQFGIYYETRAQRAMQSGIREEEHVRD